ncbi:MAG: hypothetical protein JSW34_05545 [Candidatus Zixiibacteriota bacterium]|nr:MAG: hypothetical protein JSW34_05545 [candidate division Zixibacteria bacterium]
MALLLLILDGAADAADSPGGHSTPLAAAEKPSLDSLAAQGRTGMLAPISGGMVPQTHTGVLSLLGYDVVSQRFPRGPIETFGHLGKIWPGALCARCNFSTLFEGRITSRRVCRDLSQTEANILTNSVMESLSIDSGETFYLGSVSTYRLVWMVKPDNMPLSGNVSNADPGYAENADFAIPQKDLAFRPVPCMPLGDDNTAKYTAKLVNTFIHKAHIILEQHSINEHRRERQYPPANYILARDFGIGLPQLPSILEKYGLRSAYIYELPIELGVARLLDMRAIAAPAGKDGNVCYQDLAVLISSVIRQFELIVCHIKGPDEPGHDGDYPGKIASLERIDREFFSPLVKLIDPGSATIVVTSDHATPWSLGTHSSDKVPVLVVGSSVIPDSVDRFDEYSCAKGSMPIGEGVRLLPFLLNEEQL